MPESSILPEDSSAYSSGGSTVLLKCGEGELAVDLQFLSRCKKWKPELLSDNFQAQALLGPRAKTLPSALPGQQERGADQMALSFTFPEDLCSYRRYTTHNHCSVLRVWCRSRSESFIIEILYCASVGGLNRLGSVSRNPLCGIMTGQRNKRAVVALAQLPPQPVRVDNEVVSGHQPLRP